MCKSKKELMDIAIKKLEEKNYKFFIGKKKTLKSAYESCQSIMQHDYDLDFETNKVLDLKEDFKELKVWK